MDYRLTIDVKGVAEGDALDVAQAVYDEHGADLDASLGDFTIAVGRVENGNVYWEPLA